MAKPEENQDLGGSGLESPPYSSTRREQDCARLHDLKMVLGEDKLFEILDELPSDFDSAALLSLARFGLGKEKILSVMYLGLSAADCDLIARMICLQNGADLLGEAEEGANENTTPDTTQKA